jgi:hypothetical protein
VHVVSMTRVNMLLHIWLGETGSSTGLLKFPWLSNCHRNLEPTGQRRGFDGPGLIGPALRKRVASRDIEGEERWRDGER